MGRNISSIVYTAAGGVVVNDGSILVLSRITKGEVRLPKGHVEPGESIEAAALREVYEESGYIGVQIVSGLGSRVIEFDHGGRHYIRTEHYFLMKLADSGYEQTLQGEEQFRPIWLDWSDAIKALSYEFEKDWVRRAQTEYGSASAAVDVQDR